MNLNERILKNLFISFWALAFFNTNNIVAQTKAPSLQWQKSFGGSKLDRASSICPLPKGGFIMIGYTESNDGDVKNYIGYGDYLLICLDQSGSIQWQKCLGGSSREYPSCISLTNDEGYIVAGYSYSNDKDVSGNHGYSDAWVVKLDKTGNIEWQKCFGGSRDDDFYSITQTTDGGFIAAGFTESDDGDVSSNYGKSDLWIVKLDSKGNLRWQNNFGGSEDDVAQSIIETKNGGYIIAGYTRSNDINVSKFKGAVDAWIIKLSSNGILEWEKTFGGSQVESAESIKSTTDGGYIFTGTSSSQDGDVDKTYGNVDLWVVKLDAKGQMEWNKVFGGSGEDRGSDIIQTSDSVYVVAGFSFSNDGNLSTKNGDGNAWIISISKTGDLLWQKIFDGVGESMLYCLKATNDNGLIAVGFSSDKPGNSINNSDAQNLFVVKLIYNQTNLWIPNAFTPNGDGLNDVWRLSFLSSFPNCKVEIFNRWGQLIFSSNGYQQPWDGTYKGTKLSSGVYCYLITTTPGQKQIKGSVLIIR